MESHLPWLKGSFAGKKVRFAIISISTLFFFLIKRWIGCVFFSKRLISIPLFVHSSLSITHIQLKWRERAADKNFVITFYLFVTIKWCIFFFFVWRFENIEDFGGIELVVSNVAVMISISSKLMQYQWVGWMFLFFFSFCVPCYLIIFNRLRKLSK